MKASKPRRKLFEVLANYWQLDRRGVLLNVGLLLVVAVVISFFSTSTETIRLAWPEWRGFGSGLIFLSIFVIAFGLAFKSPRVLLRILGVAFVASLVIFGAYAITVAYASIIVFASAVAFVGVIAFAGVGGIAVALTFVFIGGVAFGSAFSIAASSIFVFYPAALTLAFIIRSRFQLIEMYQQRAATAQRPQTYFLTDWEESGQRYTAWEMLCKLLSGRFCATLGLAGRRGTGKTNFLKRLLKKVNPLPNSPKLTY